jgi:formylglycine-generating enzyme required for sulfatase activity
VVTVNPKGEVVERKPGEAKVFSQTIGDSLLDMVAIPGGTFLMGSPEGELERSEDEGPQHEVTLDPFFMGRYPITQAQWRAVASLPQVKLKLDPDPSNFKGDNRPVEQVNWHDAMEFCDRLSQELGQPYTLPSEAQWEYACRAGTTTPFHFGETITTDLANYDGNYTFASGPAGVPRGETTEVGSFPPNGFGLYDMHGNVFEWCLDHYHDSYKEAPADGSAWESGGGSNPILRGGSWYYPPSESRCAYRVSDKPNNRYSTYGFRVVCAPPGLL